LHWRESSVCTDARQGIRFACSPDDGAREARLRVGGGKLTDLFDADELRSRPGGVHSVRLEPYGYRWFRLGDLDQALARREVD
jgi:hypothetical protein